MRRPRHLSAGERALWDRVAERTTPIKPTSHPKQKNTPEPKASFGKPKMGEFRVGQKVSINPKDEFLPSVKEGLPRAPLNMDHKSFTKMKQGKLLPESKIDLHGMTLAEAHPALIGFILRSQKRGLRLVLVITGKGKNHDDGGVMPARLGLLRHQVPQWLALPPIAQLILQVTPAHIKHGGQGAYYVYLKRAR